MIHIRSADEFVRTRTAEQSHTRERQVAETIVAAVRDEGDAAVRKYTLELDGVALSSFAVPQEQWERAYSTVDVRFVEALRRAIVNIRRFHEQQRRNAWFITDEEGSMLGQVIRPIERVGVYVPGGRAAYPSSAMMNIIPAQVAGVEKIVVCTPCDRDGQVNPAILVALAELGVNDVYRIGGAQAIAALAYGTEMIPSVDKIVGPGNIYVALAKQVVFGRVGIDMLAGPSEVLVIADDEADADYVAADLLSQAEHDPMAAAILVTTSERLAVAVQASIVRQWGQLTGRNRDDAAQSLASQGAILIVETVEDAIRLSNRVAPEHVELLVRDPHQYIGMVKHAGAIFLGPYSTEPVGDYYAGSNHILPTSGTARFSSGLSVDEFVKKSSVIQYGRQALLRHGHDIIALAQAEGLTGHAEAVRVRLQKERENGQA